MTLFALALPLIVVAVVWYWFFFDPEDTGPGQGGQSFTIGGQFVIVDNGYDSDRVTYVVVRNWPISSSPDDRLKDQRFVYLGVDKPKVKLPGGGYDTVEGTPCLYFFDGDDLTVFPISMREDDFMHFQPRQMTSYAEVLAFFRQYEVSAP